MNSVLLVDPPMALQHHPIGASTGYMEDLRGSWDALVEEACAVSSFAVELAALSEPELGPLRRLPGGDAVAAVPLPQRPRAEQAPRR